VMSDGVPVAEAVGHSEGRPIGRDRQPATSALGTTPARRFSRRR
jgi:hypothetical protein